MQEDPFGNLSDWGQVLEHVDELAESADLTECQPGLIRILQYKGNWRLREKVLIRVGEIQTPSDELVYQVLAVLADDNTYYDARILAGDALSQLLKSAQNGFREEINKEIRKVVEKLSSAPQPPFFNNALKRLYSAVCLPET